MDPNHILINVGRQFGSGGKEIALLLGKKLGISVYDNELISEAAAKNGVSPEFFRKGDEKQRLLKFGNIFGLNHYSDGPDGLNDAELFKMQSDTIREIAGKGPAIFVGRASDYVLRDMDCLDVFISAPIENRKERVSGRRGISLEEAGVLIEKMDKGRANYYNFFTLGSWGQASGYDLCIDSSKLGIDKSSDIIIEFLKKTF